MLALYTKEAIDPSEEYQELALKAKIIEVYESVNLAMADSDINLEINLVDFLKVSPGVEHARQRGK